MPRKSPRTFGKVSRLPSGRYRGPTWPQTASAGPVRRPSTLSPTRTPGWPPFRPTS